MFLFKKDLRDVFRCAIVGRMKNPNDATSFKAARHNSIIACQNHVAAHGPCSRDSFEFAIRDQTNTREEDVAWMANEAIVHGISTGWLEQYDDQSFCVKQ